MHDLANARCCLLHRRQRNRSKRLRVGIAIRIASPKSHLVLNAAHRKITRQKRNIWGRERESGEFATGRRDDKRLTSRLEKRLNVPAKYGAQGRQLI